MGKDRKDQRHNDSIDYWLGQAKRGTDNLTERLVSAKVTDRVLDALDSGSVSLTDREWGSRLVTRPSGLLVPDGHLTVVTRTERA